MKTLTGENILTRIIAGRPLKRYEAEKLSRWLIVNHHKAGNAGAIIQDWLDGQGIRPIIEDVYLSDMWAKDATGPLADDGDFSGHDNQQFAGVLRKTQRRQISEILSDLNALANLAKGAIDILISDDRLMAWREEIRRASRPELEKILTREGGKAIRAAIEFAARPPKVIAAFDLENRRALEFLADETRAIGKAMTDQFRAELRKELFEGVEQGESVDQITKRIRKIDDSFTKPRARRIARTETAFAFIESNIGGWEQSGVVVGKRFRCAPGCCPFCQAAQDHFPDTKTIQLREPMFMPGSQLAAEFTKADGTKVVRRLTFDYIGIVQSGGVMGPPIHPNCRCDLQPVIAEEFA